jgi:uncharacterized cofD-like protein
MPKKTPHLNALRQVVAMGGGHGLGRMLAALAFLEDRLAGIVTTTDNGGSTGRLRQSRGGIAWGDLRNCLNQIARLNPTTASRLFEYRFSGHDELAGHNLGNLIFHALDDMHATPVETVNLVRQYLGIKPWLFPMSEEPCHLVACCDGEMAHGEVQVDQLNSMPDRMFLHPEVSACEPACDSIRAAELVVIGPGSFFTSMMPPLLLPGITDALKASGALKVIIGNLAPEEGIEYEQSLPALLHWCQLNTGFVPDAVISNDPVSGLPDGIRLMVTEVRSNKDPRLHNTRKIARALDRLAGEHRSGNA